MRRGSRTLVFLAPASALILLLKTGALHAQDLDPRAYAATPLGTNFAALALGRTWGDVLFDPSLPVSDVRARLGAVALGYYRSFDFFGQSANFRVAFPYAWGHLEGLLNGEFTTLDRFGLADARAQVTVNLLGAPAMTRQEFARYRPGTNLWASFTVAAPSGQYSPDKLVNIGNHRWAFKPEVAATHALGKFTLEGYAGAWFFTTNDEFYRGAAVRSQDPMFTAQAHVTYTFRPGLWAGADGTIYSGGRTTVDGVVKNDRQTASRVGIVGSWAIERWQAFKFQYTRTTSARVGGNFDILSFGYTYTWFDR